MPNPDQAAASPLIMSASKIVVAFDLYGTLVSTDSVTSELAKHFPNDTAKNLAAVWRRLQLEYTFRLNSMGE